MQSFKGRVSGFSVKTIDTTGAGDAFVGALLVSMAKDTSIFHVFILFYFCLAHFNLKFFYLFIFFMSYFKLNYFLLFLFRMKQNLETL